MPEPAASDVLTAMIGAFQPLVPTQIAGLPRPSLAVARAELRGAGIGNFIGGAPRGSIGAVEQLALWVRATIRFTLWGFVAFDVDDAVTNLTNAIFARRADLAAQGFLKLAFDASSPPEETREPVAWRRFADYDVLYEFPYEDVGGAAGLILPIEAHEDATGSGWRVLGDLGRWDDQSAPLLSIRGQAVLTALAALSFIADPLLPPTGGVTLTRTFDGAPAPADAGTLANFLANVTASSAPARNQLVSVASLSELLSHFAPDGAPLDMGDRNNDGIADRYSPSRLDFPAPLTLASVADRFELSFAQPKFDHIGVVYLRAIRRGG